MFDALMNILRNLSFVYRTLQKVSDDFEHISRQGTLQMILAIEDIASVIKKSLADIEQALRTYEVVEILIFSHCRGIHKESRSHYCKQCVAQQKRNWEC